MSTTTVKNIFVQVDTEGIIYDNLIGRILDTEPNYLEQCVLCDQGSMVLGSNIKLFTVEVVKDCNLTFTVVPLELFTFNLLSFSAISFSIDSKKIDIVTLPKDVKGVISFNVDHAALKDYSGKDITFELTISLKVPDGNALTFTIDPVLRIKQQ